MKTERYTVINNFASEPSNSFIQAIELNVTNYLNYLMSAASDKIDMFKNYNPISEGLVINDIDIQTYQSSTNEFHFLHTVIIGAVNTTRYNTISFKAELYQDTTNMMNSWNNEIKKVINSQDVSLTPNGGQSAIYVSLIDLLNNTSCVLGQESDCEFKGHSFSNNFDYAKANDINWLSYAGLNNTTYNQQGNYDENGIIKIVDTGPSNFDNLLQSFKLI